MPQTITGYFDTRRDAEMTVEHLVQDHGLDRNSVQATAEGEENSSSTVVSGADAAAVAEGEAPQGYVGAGSWSGPRWATTCWKPRWPASASATWPI